MRIGGRGHASPACATRAAAWQGERAAAEARAAAPAFAAVRERSRLRSARPRRRTEASRPRRGRAGGRTRATNALGAAVVPVHDRARELGRVLVERPRDGEQPAADLQQVAEVERALLDALVLGVEHGQHRPADDRRLDHRARVQADDRAGCGRSSRSSRPSTRRRSARGPPAGTRRRRADLDAVPGVGPLRVRTDEDAELCDGIAPRAQRLRPTPDEVDLRLAGPGRAARVEHERPTGIEARRGRRTRARGRGCQSNHSSKHCAPVTTTCSRDRPRAAAWPRRAGSRSRRRVGPEWAGSTDLLDRLSQLLTQHRGAQPERLGGAEEVRLHGAQARGTA